MSRPAGLAPGALALVGAWVIAAAIARLTGAAAVLILLVAGAVGGLWALSAGWVRLQRSHVSAVVLPAAANVGEPVAIEVTCAGPPVSVELVDRSGVIATGVAGGDRASGLTATFLRRGVVSELTVRVRAAGRPGLVWWVRSETVAVTPCTVAPALAGPGASVLTVPRSQGLDVVATAALRSAPGELDGVRAWRDGDSERAVHWPTSLRTGELVVHDQRGGPPDSVLVRAAPAPPDPEEEAGRVRWALERALRVGGDVWVAIGDGDPVPVTNASAAASWTATCDLGAKGTRRRRWSVSRATFEPADVPMAGRWWTAAAAWVAVAMLVGALTWPMVLLPVLGGAIAFGAWTALRHPPSVGAAPAWQRRGVALIALAGLALIAARSGGITGLLALLRGPMPEFLVLLVVLHGVEARDRRTVRVHLAVSAVVAAYATGLRVDGAVGPWLALWCTCFAVALVTTGTFVGARRSTAGERVATGAIVAGALAATVALLGVVPVPDGPARLTLPAFIDEIRTVGSPGALARPDGALAGAGIGTGARGIAAESGAYEGFTEALDTSVRGELGDDVVMRVRAPEPDFWRGQTFADFDGRVWTADPDVGQLQDGPEIDVPPAFGEARVPPSDRERFVQTFFVESDLPNVIFAASRPRRVIFDGGVWVRPDGSLRTDVVLTEGAVYTVESSRVEVTAPMLQSQGDVAGRLTDLGREAFAPYLALPASTSQRTRDLAASLAPPGTSTYDTVRALEGWIAANVVYDLDAPVPAVGTDAVDDFLFVSQRGFCEQIASSLVVMLRSLGVPARLATGYLPGQRDRVTGVWEVRARDAHARVEVWFPATGWQAFDPTAEVPLAGEVDRGTIGSDLVDGAVDLLSERGGTIAVVVLIGAGVVGMFVAARTAIRRRRRGQWGVLQDRFHRVAAANGVPATATNPAIARELTDVDPVMGAYADEAASALDRWAFDPDWMPGDDDLERVTDAVGRLVSASSRR